MSDYTLYVYREFPEEAQLIHQEEEKLRDVPESERPRAVFHLMAFGHCVIEASPRRDEIRAMLAREKEAERAAFRKLFHAFTSRQNCFTQEASPSND